MRMDRWHCNVLIPACNEEELLPRCLESVLEAREKLAGLATCDIIVVVDQSVDATFTVARRLVAAYGSVIRSDAGVVGLARATAARTALAHTQHPLERIWLANTDADCWVPSSWLVDQLRLAEDGAEAIAGTVDVDSFAEHETHVLERFRSTYLLYPDGTHPHVHGANLGIRADTYLRAGGWADRCTAEDHDLWNRLTAIGARKISPSDLRILTSGRRIGRAPMGFAAALAAHNEVAA